ncbi:hypothetical protein KQI41_00070 [Tissierella pigra]|uniref:Regulatory protein YycH domain-containing protein n=1 Tax=Tissierella pigra TaxID=2607614 RepID=A0A6N7Y1T1_9FIRM|nr:hypothetical protein [Tissierella pigra]MBU5424786.1 hypothetical protein [Tissierella pigra]MSU02794.1 hypothetical protein [Tissierella pigra]
MMERFKTFILMSLVCISLVFTKRLWIELPNEMINIFNNKKEVYGVSYLLSDMIVPNKYLLNFGYKNHTLFYDDYKHRLWTNSRNVLNNILGSKSIEISELPNDEFSTYNGKRSLVFYFPEKVNTYILAKSLDVKDPNLIVDNLPSVKSIYISLVDKDSFCVFSDGEKNLLIYDKSMDLDNLKKQINSIKENRNYNNYFSMKEALEVNNDTYISYEMKSTLPTIHVENEIRNLDEEEKKELVEKFFNKNIDYIREIVESNGSTIYIYNQKVLKLNINGSLEYFHPLEELVRKRNLYQSLTTASEFISKSPGVPKGMYLAKVEEIEVDNNLGYNLTFRYRVKGIPIILGNEEVTDFVQIEVFNDHIRSYKHFIRKDMNKSVESVPEAKRNLASFDILDMNIDFIVEKYLEKNDIQLLEGEEPVQAEVLETINDITLSYFDPCLKDIEDELIPVWVIRMGDGLYAFNVYDGSLVYEKN